MFTLQTILFPASHKGGISSRDTLRSHVLIIPCLLLIMMDPPAAASLCAGNQLLWEYKPDLKTEQQNDCWKGVRQLQSIYRWFFYVKISSCKAGRAALLCSKSLEPGNICIDFGGLSFCLQRYAEIDRKSDAVIPPPKELCFRDVGPLSVIDNA